MNNINRILKLKNKIEQELTPLITSDYVLLDVPNYDNIGDNLIWEGELNFLRDNIPYKKLYECSLDFFVQSRIPKYATILLQGGGNFGDIYPVVNDFRKKVILDNLDKKIIIFPQTIYYNDSDNLREDAKIINQHKDLTICVRDFKSYELAKDNFTNANILLLPDMAFCIEFEKYRKDSTKVDKVLVMDRRDSEKVSLNLNNLSDYDLFDWPTFNMTKEERFKKIKFQRRIDKIAAYLINVPLFNHLVDSRYGFKSKRKREEYVDMGISFFKQYNTIYTTRLHGLILGVLMGKDMKVLDNSYGKLTNFTNQWLNDFENVEVINDGIIKDRD